MNSSAVDDSDDSTTFTMDNLPTLPDGLGAASAALWAGNVLLAEGARQRWDAQIMRETMLVLVLMLFRHFPEEVVIGRVRDVLRQISCPSAGSAKH
jgi:hypothetical protein